MMMRDASKSGYPQVFRRLRSTHLGLSHDCFDRGHGQVRADDRHCLALSHSRSRSAH